MNKQQAMIKLRKLWGDKAMWRYDESAPTADQREEAEALRLTLRQARNEAEAAMEARRAELLADPEYVRLKEAYQDADKRREANDMITRHYRVTIGRSTGFAFMVEAQGDNWQDAFDKLDAKRNAKVTPAASVSGERQ
jgi:hypothetical protein